MYLIIIYNDLFVRILMINASVGSGIEHERENKNARETSIAVDMHYLEGI